MKDNEENGGEEQDNPTLFDIVRKNPTMTYNEATKVQEDTRLEREAKKGEGLKKKLIIIDIGKICMKRNIR